MCTSHLNSSCDPFYSSVEQSENLKLLIAIGFSAHHGIRFRVMITPISNLLAQFRLGCCTLLFIDRPSVIYSHLAVLVWEVPCLDADFMHEIPVSDLILDFWCVRPLNLRFFF